MQTGLLNACPFHLGIAPWFYNLQVAYCFHLCMFIVCCDNNSNNNNGSHNRCVRIIFVDHFDTHSRHVKSKPNYHNFSMMLFQVIASIYAEITMFQTVRTHARNYFLISHIKCIDLACQPTKKRDNIRLKSVCKLHSFEF